MAHTARGAVPLGKAALTSGDLELRRDKADVNEREGGKWGRERDLSELLSGSEVAGGTELKASVLSLVSALTYLSSSPPETAEPGFLPLPSAGSLSRPCVSPAPATPLSCLLTRSACLAGAPFGPLPAKWVLSEGRKAPLSRISSLILLSNVAPV